MFFKILQKTHYAVLMPEPEYMY